MVAGALVFGAALHAVTPLASIAGGTLGIALGAGLAHGRWLARLLGAGCAMAVLCLAMPSWTALIGAAASLAIAVAAGGPRGLRGALGAVLGAVALLTAIWCALRIGQARQTVHWPAIATTMVSAAAMALVGVLATLPRHLQLVRDPVQAALKRLPAALDAEVRALCGRAAAIWQAVQQRGIDDSAAELVRDGVCKTLEVAASSTGLAHAGPSDPELAQRISDLDQRIAGATDGEVKAQYQAARAAVGDQQRYRARLEQSRARLIARLHNHVAALEKFELATTGLGASQTSLAASLEAFAVADALEEIDAPLDAPTDAPTGKKIDGEIAHGISRVA